MKSGHDLWHGDRDGDRDGDMEVEMEGGGRRVDMIYGLGMGMGCGVGMYGE